MLVAFKRSTIIGLVLLLSVAANVRRNGHSPTTLFVNDELAGEKLTGKTAIIDRPPDGEVPSSAGRQKRQAATSNSPGVQKNISTWVSCLYLLAFHP